MTAVATPDIEQNHILAALPTKERRILREHLDVVTLYTKEYLNEVDTPVRYLHFPVDSAISLMDLKSGGGVVEVAAVGKEGCTGFTMVQGHSNALCRVIVEVGGLAFRLSGPVLMTTLPQLPFFRYALYRFAMTILRESIISVGCSQFHSVEQRIGRWLLAHQHRTGRSVFAFTHDFLAEQLGAQRVTITDTLAALQEKQLIRYGYREVELINVKATEQLSCECFPAVKEAIDHFLRDIKSYNSTLDGL
jgi:hypothetical protein